MSRKVGSMLEQGDTGTERTVGSQSTGESCRLPEPGDQARVHGVGVASRPGGRGQHTCREACGPP